MQRKLCIENLEDRRVLATLIINTPDDEALSGGIGDDDGNLTLREAVAIVNGSYSPTALNGDKLQIDENVVGGVPTEPLGTNDKIVFHPDVFGTGPGKADTIYLLHGELEITRSVIIDGAGVVNVDVNSVPTPTPGPGWLGLTIDASTFLGNTEAVGDGARIFNISLYGVGRSVEIRDLSLTGGDPADSGGAIYASVGTESDLKLSRLYVHDNQSRGHGGGVYADVSSGRFDVLDVIAENNHLTTNEFNSTQPRMGGGVALLNYGGAVSVERLVARS